MHVLNRSVSQYSCRLPGPWLGRSVRSICPRASSRRPKCLWVEGGGGGARSPQQHLLTALDRPPQVACETATKTGMVMVFGEITTKAKVDYEAVVRRTCREVGFISEDVGLDCDKCKVKTH